MAERWGLVLLGADGALRRAVAAACPPPLQVVTPDRRPDVDAAVGVAVVPWPGHGEEHAAARAAVDAPYWAVESWHRHPAFVDALRGAIARGRSEVGGDAHVLVTAPDRAGRSADPADRVFLREVTQAVAEGEPAGRCTLAWDHGPAEDPVAPTAATVLGTLAEGHGRTAVVRASVDPFDAGDPAVVTAAAAASLDLVQVAVAPDVLPNVLAQVAATVVAHEAAP